MREHDGRRERRAHDRPADARDERRDGHVRELRELAEAVEAGRRSDASPSSRTRRARRRRRRRRRARSCRRASGPSSRRSGRAARSGRPCGRPGRSRAPCTAGPWRIWIDHARSARRQSATPDERREPADADEEAGAAEERRVRARVRLKRGGRREGSAEACACAGDRGGRWLRRLRQVERRLRSQCRRAPGGPLFVCELVGEQSEPETAPGELSVGLERGEAVLHRRQALGLERSESSVRAPGGAPASRARPRGARRRRCSGRARGAGLRRPRGRTWPAGATRSARLRRSEGRRARARRARRAARPSAARSPRLRAPLAGIATIARLALAAAELEAALGHCHVPCRHSIAALQRRHFSSTCRHPRGTTCVSRRSTRRRSRGRRRGSRCPRRARRA